MQLPSLYYVTLCTVDPKVAASSISEPNREAAGEDNAPILFYTNIQRTFRTTLIGYLYQLCRRYRVVLLAENLDNDTQRLLSNRSLFPGLIAQVWIGQYDTASEGLIAKHRRLSRLAREIVEEWQPGAVFAAGVDLFECYLRRHAKQACDALIIGCIGLLPVREAGEALLFLNLHSAESCFPGWLPSNLRLLLAQARRWLAQFIYYVIAPMAVGMRPFLGLNGIFRLDYTRLTDVDCSFVFTHTNKDMLLAAGAPREKLVVIPHPMKPGAADEVWQAYGINRWLRQQRADPRQRVATCLLDIECQWGFRRDDLLPIPDEVLYASRAQVIEVIVATLPGWEIRIKPHPMSGASPLYLQVRRSIENISPSIVWLSPSDNVDRHIVESKVVIGFPPASTAIYSAIMLCPGIPVIVVDINRELRGDAYVGMRGVMTVETWQELEATLAAIAAGRWIEAPYDHEHGDFETLTDLIEVGIKVKAAGRGREP